MSPPSDPVENAITAHQFGSKTYHGTVDGVDVSLNGLVLDDGGGFLTISVGGGTSRSPARESDVDPSWRVESDLYIEHEYDSAIEMVEVIEHLADKHSLELHTPSSEGADTDTETEAQT